MRATRYYNGSVRVFEDDSSLYCTSIEGSIFFDKKRLSLSLVFTNNSSDINRLGLQVNRLLNTLKRYFARDYSDLPEFDLPGETIKLRFDDKDGLTRV